MKKIFFLVSIFLLIGQQSFADEWDNLPDIERNFQEENHQPTYTNKDYEDVIEHLEEQKIKKESKKKKKRWKKISGGGTSLHKDLAPESAIKELDALSVKDKNVLLNLPVDVEIGDKVLEKGFYNVQAYKNEDGILQLEFYQSQYLIGRVNATETNDDFGEDDLYFVKMQPYNSEYIKILYGSIDFNGYAFLKIKF